MYLSELNIWNFRKYGYSDLTNRPSLTVNFNEGMNLIVGENDSGKTTIIDAIKYVLGTQSYDGTRIEENDFYKCRCEERVKELKIECVFKKLSDVESGKFLEWINFDKDKKSELRVRLIAIIKDNKIIQKRTAGVDGLDISFEASDLLRVTYLKPLRDAENELSPGYKSRFAQILKSHPIFIKDNRENKHPLEVYIKEANYNIEHYFKKEYLHKRTKKEAGGKLIKVLNETLAEFIGMNEENYEAKVSIANMELNKILSRLMLNMDENKVGLGSLNQLYIAMELLLLEVKKDNEEFGMALIEEVEAHLHPQAQLRLIKYLQRSENQQSILTTHSITLASVVNLENLIVCRGGKAFAMGHDCTNLSSGDYEFLQRFLDATKSNLFFAKGVIFVEGDAENILVPTLAQLIDRPLFRYGVSLVNVGNIAFLRYINIFIRKNKEGTIGIPASIVTDLDVRPKDYYLDEANKTKNKGYKVYIVKDIDELEGNRYLTEEEAKKDIRRILQISAIKSEEKLKYIEEIEDYNLYKNVIKENKEYKYNFKDIKVFTNNWTMEYDLALSCIKENIHAAIIIAKKIKKDEECIGDINLDYYIELASKHLRILKLKLNEEEIAYKIYKPLLENNASKAVTAQYLSKILNSLNKNNKLDTESLKKDQYLRYIIEAIYHVTETEEGEVIS